MLQSGKVFIALLTFATISFLSCDRIKTSYTLEEALDNVEHAHVVIIENDSDIEFLDRIHELHELTTLEIKNPKIKKLPLSVRFHNEIVFLTFKADSCEFPSQIFQIDSLFELVVSCKLKELPGNLAQARNLKTLKIQRSHLDSIPKSILAIPNLRSLDLSFNNITFIPENYFLQDHSLQELNLNFNPIRSLPLAVFNTNISWLRLSNLELHALPDNIVFTGTSIDLGGNHLAELPDDIRADRLIEIFLEGNEFVQFPIELTTFTSLSRILAINSNSIKTIPKEIENLNELKILQLEENQIEFIPIEISSLEKLEVLDLKNNDLESIPLELSRLKKMTSLILIGNRFPVEEIRKINESALKDIVTWTSYQ
jgi:Leucine-rich repeat (LRR) protein